MLCYANWYALSPMDILQAICFPMPAYSESLSNQKFGKCGKVGCKQ